MKRSFLVFISPIYQKRIFWKNWNQFFIFSIKSKIIYLFSIGLGIDFNSYLIHWDQKLFPFLHQIFISSYFHKYSPNSSQTFQSFKISLIFLQQSFKIRITLFSCIIFCYSALQIWKGNEVEELEIDLTYSFLKNGLALASINTFATSIWLWYDAFKRSVHPS